MIRFSIQSVNFQPLFNCLCKSLALTFESLSTDCKIGKSAWYSRIVEISSSDNPYYFNSSSVNFPSLNDVLSYTFSFLDPVLTPFIILMIFFLPFISIFEVYHIRVWYTWRKICKVCHTTVCRIGHPFINKRLYI